MLRSVLVGMDGSAYSTTALALGIRWAQHWDAVLVGLGIVDAPTICMAEPVPLGATAYKGHRDTRLLVDAHHQVGQFLEDCAQQCAGAGVTTQVRQELVLRLRACFWRPSGLISSCSGSTPFFTLKRTAADDIHPMVLKQSPRPVITVPTRCRKGREWW